MSSIAFKTAALAAAALTVVAVAGAAPTAYSDPTGDNGAAADIGAVTADLAADGYVHVKATIANLPALYTPGFVGLALDTDRSGSTGSIRGADYIFARRDVQSQRLALQVGWQQLRGCTDPGGRRALPPRWWWDRVPRSARRARRCDVFQLLGRGEHRRGRQRAGRLRARQRQPGSSRCRSRRPLLLRRLPSPPRRRRRTPLRCRRPARCSASRGPAFGSTTAPTVAATTFRCRATLGGKAVRGTGTGGCSFAIPKTAKGKRLVVTVSATHGGRTLSIAPRTFVVR